MDNFRGPRCHMQKFKPRRASQFVATADNSHLFPSIANNPLATDLTESQIESSILILGSSSPHLLCLVHD